jgi:hypothetical protein
MKSYALGGRPPALARPRFGLPQVIATPVGIFFGPNESPGLLYVAWADVDDWLAKHDVSGKSGATKSKATVPREAEKVGTGNP